MGNVHCRPGRGSKASSFLYQIATDNIESIVSRWFDLVAVYMCSTHGSVIGAAVVYIRNYMVSKCMCQML